MGGSKFSTARRLIGRSSVLLLVVLGLNSVLTGRSSGAENATGFAATASASGGRIEYTIPGFTVEQVVDGGAPLAQAYLDSRAGAVSFASFPYPGENALAVPGLLSSSTGQPPPPAYPFYVRASHPLTPVQELKDPSATYHLLSRAAEGDTSGLAELRGQAGDGPSNGSGGSSASTSVRVDKNTVTATADTVNEALDIGGGALRVASIRSRSVTTHTIDGNQTTKKTSLIIEGGSAGGYSFAFGPQGLVVANQTVPFPAAGGLDQLNGALKPVGISIAFGEQPLADGAAARTFEIRMQQDSPPAPLPATVVTLRFGGATTTIAGSPGEGTTDLPIGASPGGVLPPGDDGGGVSSPTPSPGQNPGSTTPTKFFDPAPAPGPSAASSVALASEGSAVGGGFAGGGESLGSLPAPRLTAGPAGDGSSVGPRQLKSQEFVYGVILGGAILLMAVSTLWRGKGGLPI